MQVRHVVVTAGLEVDEQGGLAANVVDSLEGDGALEGGVPVGDGEEVDDAVGRAADGLEDSDGVVERVVG